MPQYHSLDTREQIDHFLLLLAKRRSTNKSTTVCFSSPDTKRSIDQNALFQKWAREYACHTLNKQTVSEAEHDAMKYTLQRHAYADTGWAYLLGEKRDLFTGEVKPDRAHTKNFDKGEMHQFLNWVQNRAAQDGLMLESLGEYQQLQAEQVA